MRNRRIRAGRARHRRFAPRRGAGRRGGHADVCQDAGFLTPCRRPPGACGPTHKIMSTGKKEPKKPALPAAAAPSAAPKKRPAKAPEAVQPPDALEAMLAQA